MNRALKFGRCIGLCVSLLVGGIAQAQQKEIPEALKPWEGWVTWGEQHPDCPTPYDNADKHICFWPSRLSLSANRNEGAWTAGVTVFEETWVPLPGSGAVWPLNVRANGELIPVLARDGSPFVQLPAGLHQLSGDFRWEQMPQRIAIPKQVGILSLVVDGARVPIPNWDAEGNVWLKRVRSGAADKDLLAVQVYRVVEDGVPIWLRTEIELTVSGKSREEQLGWILPQGWKLSMVESPIPVAVDDRGQMKAQVRAGKWTIGVHAFHATDIGEFKFAPNAKPVTSAELIAFRAKPEFRIAEFEGIQAVDVTQTTFPTKWRGLPVYAWETTDTFRLVEKMRGMGLRRPEGLNINRRFWLDEDGEGFTYRDTIRGSMQQIWRLDVAEGQQLGAVRVDDAGQLITANPQTGAHGVEIRVRDLRMEAVGRTPRTRELSATGWRTGADALRLTLTLPPGWRVFALFGADRVEGDWLTAWSLLDLFLLLIFALAVFRLWGVKAGIVALLAFGLAYHEPGAPRLTWFFLLMPLALLRVVAEGTGKRWIRAWKYLALALLVLNLVPFAASQVQNAIYPQLEIPGRAYAPRGMFGWLGYAYERGARMADYAREDMAGRQEPAASRLSSPANLLYDPNARIQTGPAEPAWSWNQVDCYWNGPVSAEQRIKPILISLPLRRALTVVRLISLLLLTALLFGLRRIPNPFWKRRIAVAVALAALLSPDQSLAQFPEAEMLESLRARLLEPADVFPRAADISAVELHVNEGRIVMQAEVHAALKVAVPLPGRLPAWSPLTVKIDDQSDVVVRRSDGYLWVTVPEGVHKVVVEGLLPDAPEWEWTFLLKPRHVSIDAPAWDVTGVGPNGVPEQQVFFVRKQQLTEGEAAYDQKHFHAIVAVERRLEIGLVWKVRNMVTRLSSPGKAVSLQVPLLARESVLTSNVVVENGLIEVRLGAGETQFAWESELPVGGEIRLDAQQTDQWVERWYLVTSPVWNVVLSRLAPVFESQEQNLIPAWHPWPGEGATLALSKPAAVSGDTITVQHVRHETALGSRGRTTQLKLDLECSLAMDFMIGIDPAAVISSLKLDGQMIPVRRDAAQLIVPSRPGQQVVEVTWRTSEPMQTFVGTGQVTLPVAGSNVTTVMRVPESRWVLWAEGPLQGPAVRFWVIVVCAILAAVALGSLSLSPLRRLEWVLLTLGLTQVHVAAAMLVVAWLFVLAWRGKLESGPMRAWRFNLLQIGLVLLTCIALGILVVVVGEGLLGNPEMLIIGNGSSRTVLQWFQPRVGTTLPESHIVSISVWFYRLLMLFWALWLATALLRWLKWGWHQFTQGGGWKRFAKKRTTTPPLAPEADA
jgi:hypothetical protein